MVDQSFYRWVNLLSKYEAFQETISLSDKPLAESYDMEQVLRFLILTEATDDELTSVRDLGVYLSSKMIDLAKSENFSRDVWARRFKATFDLLQQQLGDQAFKRFNVAKGRHEGGFLVSQFEAVACGVAWNLERGTLRADVAQAVAAIWRQRDFTEWTGSGVTAARRLRRIVPFARIHFSTQ